MREGLDGRRHRHDAAPAARAHERLLRALGEGVFPLLRPRPGEARRCAKPDALVMHPGPMNRGVEIASEVADGAAVAHPRAGRDGRRGAHGGARGAAATPAATARTRRMTPTASCSTNARLVDPATRPRRARRRARRRRRDRRRRAGRCAGARRTARGRSTARGTVLAPGLDRHARLHRRARRRAPRDARAAPARRRRPAASPRIVCMPDTDPVDRRPGAWSISCCAAPATRRSSTSIPRRRSPRASHGREMTEIGLLRRPARSPSPTARARSPTRR